MRKLFQIAAVALMCMSINTVSAQVKFEKAPVNELINKIKDGDKLLFVDLYADWCPPCKAMERDVFSRKDVGDFMSRHFVCAKYNIDESIGKELANRYQVRSIPTFLIFDKKGAVVERLVGGMSAEDLKEKLLEISKRR